MENSSISTTKEKPYMPSTAKADALIYGIKADLKVIEFLVNQKKSEKAKEAKEKYGILKKIMDEEKGLLKQFASNRFSKLHSSFTSIGEEYGWINE